MSRIINPNAPQKDPLQQILDTMRIIAQFRKSFFDLEAAKQCDGVTPPLTPEQIKRIEDEQQYMMQEMVTFILYGADNERRTNPSNSQRIVTSPERSSKDNAQDPQK